MEQTPTPPSPVAGVGAASNASPRKVEWRCHTPNLLKEVLNNPGTGILRMPLSILGRMLAQVADRAIELDDPQLNALMVRLTLYSQADPESPDYDASLVEETIKAATRPA